MGTQLGTNPHLRAVWEAVDSRFGSLANVTLTGDTPVADDEDADKAASSHPKLLKLKEILEGHFRAGTLSLTKPIRHQVDGFTAVHVCV